MSNHIDSQGYQNSSFSEFCKCSANTSYSRRWVLYQDCVRGSSRAELFYSFLYCLHPFPRWPSLCSPKGMALGPGLELGLERSGYSKLKPDPPENHHHGCSPKHLGVLTELSRISSGLLRAQTVPGLSDSCQDMDLVLRETLCKSNSYMSAFVSQLTSPSYFPLI